MLSSCRRRLASGASPFPYSTQPPVTLNLAGKQVQTSPSCPFVDVQPVNPKLPMGMTSYVSAPRRSLAGGTFAIPTKMFDNDWVPPLTPVWDWCVWAARTAGIACVKFGDKFMGSRPPEALYRLRRIVAMDGVRPTVLDNCFIAPSAVVVGDVHVGRKVTIGYNSIVRGDLGKVHLGESCTVHDKTVVIGPANIGKWSTVDPMCVIDGASVAACSMVGAGSIVMRGAKVESNSMLCAASVLLAGTIIPSGEIWSGNPAEKLGELTPEEKEFIVKAAKHMVLINLEHSDSWNLCWEEIDNFRIARERWAVWAEGMYERRVKAFYVRHGPRQQARSNPNPLSSLGDRVNGAIQFESGIPGH